MRSVADLVGLERRHGRLIERRCARGVDRLSDNRRVDRRTM
jgi:hypothetical protein